MSFIGGFFGLELPPAGAPGLASFWKMPIDPAFTFANARSALAALLASVDPPRLWLPAYVCRSVAQAAQAANLAVSYYPLSDSLQPDTRLLDSAAKAGDMILAVDYFGRPPEAAFLDFVGRRGDLKFVEDACQAIDTGADPWGHWCLRSPRKLVGVADGGFVVPADRILDAHRSLFEPGLDSYQAACMRFEDEAEQANGEWHAVNQSREHAEKVARRRMTRLSRTVLAGLPVEEIAGRRRANFMALAGKLEKIMFLPAAPPRFVPFGFPIRLARGLRDRVSAELIAQGIFAAIHWSDLPSPEVFTAAHSLAAEFLTLPCDHRYDPHAMLRMANIVLETVNRP
jgi:dTDP-4-amino-4,6-dideoxygalactose transaminase